MAPHDPGKLNTYKPQLRTPENMIIWYIGVVFRIQMSSTYQNYMKHQEEWIKTKNIREEHAL
jgi:hypothetical protein